MPINSNPFGVFIWALYTIFRQSFIGIGGGHLGRFPREWLCCLARTAKALCSNFGATRHGMIWYKSLRAVCLGSPRRCILITCDIHRPLSLVSMYGELKWLSGGTLFQACLLSRATASNSCRKNIGFSKLSPNSTLYRKAGYSCFLELYEKKKI